MNDDGIIDSEMDINQNLMLTEAAKEFLRETAKWAKFLAIVGFVFIGIVVIIALFAGSIMATAMASLDEVSPGGSGVFGGTFITILYIGIGLMYFMPTLYLYRFATKTQKALLNENSQLLTGGIEQLKSCFKFIGILMIVVLAFYALMIAFMLLTIGSSF